MLKKYTQDNSQKTNTFCGDIGLSNYTVRALVLVVRAKASIVEKNLFGLRKSLRNFVKFVKLLSIQPTSTVILIKRIKRLIVNLHIVINA